jgi:hypothetical protein
MGKLRELLRSPFTGGVAAVLMILDQGLSWAGLLPASSNVADQLWWLKVWFTATVIFATWGYIAWFVRWRSLTEPKARIVFDSLDANHVQHGLLRGESVTDSQPSRDEYIYALGIIGLSSRPIQGCRLVLRDSTPCVSPRNVPAWA